MARTLHYAQGMRFVHGLIAIALSPSLASGEPAAPASDQPTITKPADEQLAVALAVNTPVWWQDGNSVGVSGYIAFKEQHAIRLNVASWRYHGNVAGGLIALAMGEDGDEGLYAGRVTDVGIGYQHYSRGPFEGATLEVGLLRRAVDTRVEDDFASPSIVETDATGYLGRAMVGWSWLWARRVFLATAVGASVGRFAGTERTAATTYMPEYETRDFVRYETAFEGYLRLGVAFGL